jgi:hypothetical protein
MSRVCAAVVPRYNTTTNSTSTRTWARSLALVLPVSAYNPTLLATIFQIYLGYDPLFDLL